MRETQTNVLKWNKRDHGSQIIARHKRIPVMVPIYVVATNTKEAGKEVSGGVNS